MPTALNDYVIVGVILLVMVIFWLVVMRTAKVHPQANTVFFQCPPGECATNIYNGEKLCPQDETTSITYQASYQVCNSRYTCENSQTPYALNADGSVNPLGICEPGVICRCLNHPQCPINTMVLFTMTNGSVYFQDPATSRAQFVQTAISAPGNTGTPITFTDTNTQFCAIKAYHLNRLAPGACTFANPNIPTVPEIVSCLQSNPCLAGVLAFTPDRLTDFQLSTTNTNAIDSIPVACVPGPKYPCTGTSIPIWDRSTEAIACYNTAPSV